MLIAVPSESPGGLDAAISEHFGHCHAFTLVNVDDGAIGEVELLENGGHEQGGCMAPVMLLKQKEVTALVAGGMGMRPLSGFQQVGITVYFKEEAQSVREAVQLIIDGKGREFGEAQTCGGGEGGCGGHHEHHHHHHAPVERVPIEGTADVRDGRVVSLRYKVTNKQGELLEETAPERPMQYLHGHRNIPPGLEQALVGLEVGASKVIELAPADAFGDRDPSKIIEVPRAQLPPDAEAGRTVHSQLPNGQIFSFQIVELDDDIARLDPNHPLAGMDLIFDVTVVAVEAATDEELAHGHVH